MSVPVATLAPAPAPAAAPRPDQVDVDDDVELSPDGDPLTTCPDCVDGYAGGSKMVTCTMCGGTAKVIWS